MLKPLRQIQLYRSGQLTHQIFEPYWLQKKYYDKFKKQQYQQTILSISTAATKIYNKEYQIKINKGATDLVSNQFYISYPLDQFIPFLTLTQEQQYLNTGSQFLLQIQFGSVISIPCLALITGDALVTTVGNRPTAALSNSTFQLQLSQFQNVNVEEPIMSCFSNFVYPGQSAQSQNYAIPSISHFQCYGLINILSTVTSANNVQPDSLQFQDGLTERNFYFSKIQVNGVQLVMGSDVFSSSNQLKGLDSDQKVDYLTGSALCENTLQQGQIQVELSGVGAADQLTNTALMFGYQYYLVAQPEMIIEQQPN